MSATRILLITNGFVLFAAAMLGPIYAIFVEEIGGDLLDASFAVGLFALSAAITSYFSGKYVDRLKNPELLVAIGYLIIGLGFISYAFTTNLYVILLIQVIIGIGEATYSPAFDSLLSIHSPKGSLGAQWGKWESINYSTSGIGAIAGGLLVTIFNFQFLFILMGALTLMTAIYIFLLPRQAL